MPSASRPNDRSGRGLDRGVFHVEHALEGPAQLPRKAEWRRRPIRASGGSRRRSRGVPRSGSLGRQSGAITAVPTEDPDTHRDRVPPTGRRTPVPALGGGTSAGRGYSARDPARSPGRPRRTENWAASNEERVMSAEVTGSAESCPGAARVGPTSSGTHLGAFARRPGRTPNRRPGDRRESDGRCFGRIGPGPESLLAVPGRGFPCSRCVRRRTGY